MIGDKNIFNFCWVISFMYHTSFYLFAWEFSHAFLSSADFFSNQFFQNYNFRSTTRVSNSLELDQAECFVRPDLGPNCLQRISADDTWR